jgi:hypothetical protein
MQVRGLSIDYLSPCSKGIKVEVVVEGALADPVPCCVDLDMDVGVGVSMSGKVPSTYRVWFMRKGDGRCLTLCQVHFDVLPGGAGGGGGGGGGGNRARL